MLIAVRDIMTENTVTIGPGATIEYAVGLLLRHAISGLPVIDVNCRLLGLVS